MGVTILDEQSFALGVAQRVFLSTDATVVRLLEGCFNEPIRTAGLVQDRTAASPADAALELTGDETILRRQTVLQGSRTRRNYVYAEASLVLERLDPRLREALLSTSKPIGHLMVAHRLETFRELIRAGRTPAGAFADRLDLDPADELLFRTYRVISGGQPAMLITEYFPPFFFPSPRESDSGAVVDLDRDS